MTTETKTKNSMQDQVESDEKQYEKGQQIELFEVSSEHSRVIIRHANLYKDAQRRRLKALAKEKEQKHALLELIKKENLSRLEDGKIQFRCDGYIITVTPRDEVVRIKEESDAETE